MGLVRDFTGLIATTPGQRLPPRQALAVASIVDCLAAIIAGVGEPMHWRNIRDHAGLALG